MGGRDGDGHHLVKRTVVADEPAYPDEFGIATDRYGVDPVFEPSFRRGFGSDTEAGAIPEFDVFRRIRRFLTQFVVNMKNTRSSVVSRSSSTVGAGCVVWPDRETGGERRTLAWCGQP